MRLKNSEFQKIFGFQDLRMYCETYMNQILEMLAVEDYWILENTLFLRRQSFVPDTTSYEGWKLSVRCRLRDLAPRTKKSSSVYYTRDIRLIILRRRFLPPYKEDINDIVCVLYGEIRASNRLLQTQQSAHLHQSQSLSPVQPGQGALVTPEELEEMILPTICNSFYCEFKVKFHYWDLIKLQLNNLLYDYDQYKYLQFHSKVYPKQIHQAL